MDAQQDQSRGLLRDGNVQPPERLIHISQAGVQRADAPGGYDPSAARCRELGVAAYLTKPIRRTELRKAILTALGTREQERKTTLLTRHSLRETDTSVVPLRVLVAEDNLVNQRVVVRLLEKRGHQVLVANNGREAVEALQEQKFDLVLMDVQMPEMDGFEATAVIREQETSTGRHQRVVAMTAHAMKGDRERCLQAGMDGYLSKPVNPKELFEVLEGLRGTA